MQPAAAQLRPCNPEATSPRPCGEGSPRPASVAIGSKMHGWPRSGDEAAHDRGGRAERAPPLHEGGLGSDNAGVDSTNELDKLMISVLLQLQLDTAENEPPEISEFLSIRVSLCSGGLNGSVHRRQDREMAAGQDLSPMKSFLSNPAAWVETRSKVRSWIKACLHGTARILAVLRKGCALRHSSQVGRAKI